MSKELNIVRKSRSDGERARRVILDAAVSLATVDGLEGLTIGHLATASGMSKSGIYAHFGSKLELQLATVETAARMFHDDVVRPALDADPGRAQIIAFCEGYFTHIARGTIPGGCFFSGAALEMGTRPGPVKQRVAEFLAGFGGHLRAFAATAKGRGELPDSEVPDVLAFELNGFLLAASSNFLLFDDPGVLDVARSVIHRRLGLSATPSSAQNSV